ncbi:DUF4397 domain-containing protein [Acidovorax sp. Q11]
MNLTSKILLVAAPIAVLSACGGSSDTAQAIGTSDPQLRFANVSPYAPALTLARNGGNRTEATNVSHIFLSDYFTVDAGSADYRVSGQVNTGNPPNPEFAFSQTINFDAKRGHKYTILTVSDDSVPLPSSGSTARKNALVLVDDPTNPNLVDDQSYVRAVNGSFNAQNIDLYLIGLTETIDARTPDLPSIAFRQSSPASGSEAIRRPAGDYQVVATTAGTKNILYRGRFTIPEKRDVLFVTFPYTAFLPTEIPSGVAIAAKLQGDGGRGGRIPSL